MFVRCPESLLLSTALNQRVTYVGSPVAAEGHSIPGGKFKFRQPPDWVTAVALGRTPDHKDWRRRTLTGIQGSISVSALPDQI